MVHLSPCLYKPIYKMCSFQCYNVKHAIAFSLSHAEKLRIIPLKMTIILFVLCILLSHFIPFLNISLHSQTSPFQTLVRCLTWSMTSQMSLSVLMNQAWSMAGTSINCTPLWEEALWAWGLAVALEVQEE